MALKTKKSKKGPSTSLRSLSHGPKIKKNEKRAIKRPEIPQSMALKTKKSKKGPSNGLKFPNPWP